MWLYAFDNKHKKRGHGIWATTKLGHLLICILFNVKVPVGGGAGGKQFHLISDKRSNITDSQLLHSG